MDYPDEIVEWAKECDLDSLKRSARARKKTRDIDAATQALLLRVTARRDYRKITLALVNTFCRNMLQDVRHHRNSAAKKKAGGYSPPAKVTPGPDVKNMYLDLKALDFAIDGRRLGDLKFSEIPDIIKGQRAKAQGIKWVIDMLEGVKKLKPKKAADDATVQGELKETAVQKLFDDLNKGDGHGEADSATARGRSSNFSGAKSKRTMTAAAKKVKE